MFTSKKQRATQEIELRRGRMETYTEPLPIDTATDIPDFLSYFYRHILFQQRNNNEGIQLELQLYPTTTGKYYNELVLQQKIIPYEDFWQRYYYRTNSLERVMYELDVIDAEKKKSRTSTPNKFTWRNSTSIESDTGTTSTITTSIPSSLSDLIPQRVLSSSVVVDTGSTGSSPAAVRSTSMFIKKTIFNDLIPKRKSRSNSNTSISPAISKDMDEIIVEHHPTPPTAPHIIVDLHDDDDDEEVVTETTIIETISKSNLIAVEEQPMEETIGTVINEPSITTTNIPDSTIGSMEQISIFIQPKDVPDDECDTFMEVKQITSSSSMDVVDYDPTSTDYNAVEVTPKPKFFLNPNTTNHSHSSNSSGHNNDSKSVIPESDLPKKNNNNNNANVDPSIIVPQQLPSNSVDNAGLSEDDPPFVLPTMMPHIIHDTDVLPPSSTTSSLTNTNGLEKVIPTVKSIVTPDPGTLQEEVEMETTARLVHPTDTEKEPVPSVVVQDTTTNDNDRTNVFDEVTQLCCSSKSVDIEEMMDDNTTTVVTEAIVETTTTTTTSVVSDGMMVGIQAASACTDRGTIRPDATTTDTTTTLVPNDVASVTVLLDKEMESVQDSVISNVHADIKALVESSETAVLSNVTTGTGEIVSSAVVYDEDIVNGATMAIPDATHNDLVELQLNDKNEADRDAPSTLLKPQTAMLAHDEHLPSVVLPAVIPETATSVQCTDDDFKRAVQSNKVMAATIDIDFPQPTTSNTEKSAVGMTHEPIADPSDTESIELPKNDSLLYDQIIDSNSLLSSATPSAPIASSNMGTVGGTNETEEVTELTNREDTTTVTVDGLESNHPKEESEIISTAIMQLATTANDAFQAVSDILAVVDTDDLPKVVELPKRLPATSDISESKEQFSSPSHTNFSSQNVSGTPVESVVDSVFDVINAFDGTRSSSVEKIEIVNEMVDSMPLTPDVFQSWNTSVEHGSAVSNTQVEPEGFHDAFDPFAIATPKGKHLETEVPISFTPGVDGVPSSSAHLDSAVKAVQPMMDIVDKLIYEEFGVEPTLDLNSLDSAGEEAVVVEAQDEISKVAEAAAKCVASDTNVSSGSINNETKLAVDAAKDVVEQMSKLNTESGFTTFGNILKLENIDSGHVVPTANDNAEDINEVPVETLVPTNRDIGMPGLGLRLGELLTTKKRKQTLSPSDVPDVLEGFPSPKVAKHNTSNVSTLMQDAATQDIIEKFPKVSDGSSLESTPELISKSDSIESDVDVSLYVPVELVSAPSRKISSDINNVFKSISADDDRKAYLLDNTKSLNGTEEQVAIRSLSNTPSESKGLMGKIVRPEGADSRAATPITSNVDLTTLDRSTAVTPSRVTSTHFITELNASTNGRGSWFTSMRFIIGILIGVAIAAVEQQSSWIAMTTIPIIDKLCGPVYPGWSSTDHPMEVIVAEAPFWLPTNNTNIKQQVFHIVCGANRTRTVMKLTPTKDNKLYYFELLEAAVANLTSTTTTTKVEKKKEHLLIKKTLVRSVQVLENQITLTTPRGKVALFHPFWNINGIGNITTTAQS